MSRRSWIRHLEKRARRNLASFALTDGTTYYYDPAKAYADFIVYHYELISGEDPALPEAYRMLEKAADIPAALALLRPDRPDLAPATIDDVFDIDRLIERRELVVREEALESRP
jgi:hypothetical protein